MPPEAGSWLSVEGWTWEQLRASGLLVCSPLSGKRIIVNFQVYPGVNPILAVRGWEVGGWPLCRRQTDARGQAGAGPGAGQGEPPPRPGEHFPGEPAARTRFSSTRGDVSPPDAEEELAYKECACVSVYSRVGAHARRATLMHLLHALSSTRGGALTRVTRDDRAAAEDPQPEEPRGQRRPALGPRRRTAGDSR